MKIRQHANLKEYLQQVSLERWDAYTSERHRVIGENQAIDSGCSPWTVLMILAGSQLQILLNIQYSLSEVARFALKSSRSRQRLINDEHIHDYMKEFGNILAGRIRRSYELSNVQLSTSLPILTRGLDQIFLDNRSGLSFAEYQWQLAGLGSTIRLRATTLTSQNEAMAAPIIEEDSLGEVEFL